MPCQTMDTRPRFETHPVALQALALLRVHLGWRLDSVRGSAAASTPAGDGGSACPSATVTGTFISVTVRLDEDLGTPKI
eukprot:COSAG06_NODE_6128_length_3095_cov_53.870069_2_plen_79_part_00